MTKDEALMLALEALTNELACDRTNDADDDAAAEQMYDAIAAIKEALAQPERDPWRAAAAQPEQRPAAWEQFHEHLVERNFCPRCGKRLGLGGIHTCTPPHDKT